MLTVPLEPESSGGYITPEMPVGGAISSSGGTGSSEVICSGEEEVGNVFSVEAQQFQSHFESEQYSTLMASNQIQPFGIGGVFAAANEDEKDEVAEMLSRLEKKVVQTSLLLETAGGSMLIGFFKKNLCSQTNSAISDFREKNLPILAPVSLGFRVEEGSSKPISAHNFEKGGIRLLGDLKTIFSEIRSLCTLYFPGIWRLYTQYLSNHLKSNPIAPFSELHLVLKSDDLKLVSKGCYPHSACCIVVSGSFTAGKLEFSQLGIQFELTPGDLFFFNPNLSGDFSFETQGDDWSLLVMVLGRKIVRLAHHLSV